MAITLSEIAVRLTANTAEFVSGFGAAGQTAKRFRADLSDHIGAVGQVLEQGLSQFGQFGEEVGSILGRAGSAAGQAILSFGRLGGSMGTIVGVGAGVAAGLAVAEAGLIGVAIHSAEGAAKLGEMSEKAGVSSQTLAGLALAGRGVGVETESLVKALGFMGANAVKSAIASDYAKTSFGRLGIQVKDSAGQMKDGGQLFTEVVGKIANLPTSEQGFFVKAIFGRGGMEILPLINEGIDKITEKMGLASKLGLGDESTVAMARQFKETVAEIGDAWESVGLRLAKDLLPALNQIVERIAEWGSSGALKGFVDDIAKVVQFTLAAATAVADLGRAVKSLYGIAISGSAFGDVAKNLAGGDISGAWQSVKKRFTDIGSGVSSAFSDFSRISNATPVGGAGGSWGPTKGGNVDLSPAKEDTTLARIKERMAALQQEQVDWANTAAAASQSESLISQAVQKGNAEFGKLKTEAARDKTGAAEKFVAQNEAQIKAAAASIFYDQTVVKTNESLDKQADTLTETDKAALGLAAAYSKGGEAIAGAALDKQFAKEAAAVAELAGVRNVAALAAKLERNEALARKVASDELSSSLAKESQEFVALSPAVNALNAAYLKNDDAVRAAKIDLDLQRFSESELAKGIVVTSQQIEQKRRILTQADQQAYQGALAQEAAQFNLATQYDNQIVKLQRIADLMRSQGVSTLGVEAQIFDEQNRLIHQWDEWAGKVGNFKQKFQSVMGELVIQGRNAGTAIRDSFVAAVDGIESNLAKLLTGQKTNFKAVAQNLAESVTKAEIQKGVGKLAEHFGFKIPGLGAKADGSESNPFFVVMKGGAGGLQTIGNGPIPLFGGLNGGNSGDSESGGIGGFFGGIAHLFGGFHASGGSIPSGKWGITGEQGPEIVQGPANVTPAGPTYNITHNHNYPNAASRDLFGYTQKQNQARQARNMRLAHGF